MPRLRLILRLDEEIDTLATLAETQLNVDAILQLDCPLDKAATTSMPTEAPRVRFGVARDRAFSFYYEDNLDLLRRQGAEIIPFSPIADQALPPALDGLYFWWRVSRAIRTRAKRKHSDA